MVESGSNKILCSVYTSDHPFCCSFGSVWCEKIFQIKVYAIIQILFKINLQNKDQTPTIYSDRKELDNIDHKTINENIKP